MDTVGDWLDLVAAHWPSSDAASWDAVGLHVGARDWPVARVLLTLDVTTEVLDEAAAAGEHTLVLAHHPLLLGGLARLTPDSAGGRLALQAAMTRVAVAAAHTNLDVAADGTGTADPVVDVLGLVDVRPLVPQTREDGRVKLVTFVPPDHTDAVLDALAAAGAGTIGAYERCSFRVRGTGTFRPGDGAAPYSGVPGQDAAEAEDRLEVVVPRGRITAVVTALLAAHPYDEVAYDLHPLLATPGGDGLGSGRVGRLPTPLPLGEVGRLLREGLPSPHLRIAGGAERVVATVAAVGGSGMSYAAAARAAGADVLVTGDVKHHDVLDQLTLGLAVVDAGHHGTEHAALPAWRDALTADAGRLGRTAPVLVSGVDTDPWQ